MWVFEKAGVKYNLPIYNHCLFCLLNVKSDLGQSKSTRSSKTRGKTSSTGRCENVLPVEDFNQVWKSLKAGYDTYTFSTTPPLCDTCKNMLEKIQKLITQLKLEMRGVNSRADNTGKGSDPKDKEERVSKFLTEFKRTQVGDDERRETLKLLQIIGYGPFNERDFQGSLQEEIKIERAIVKREVDDEQHALSPDPLLDNDDNHSNGAFDEELLEASPDPLIGYDDNYSNVRPEDGGEGDKEKEQKTPSRVRRKSGTPALKRTNFGTRRIVDDEPEITGEEDTEKIPKRANRRTRSSDQKRTKFTTPSIADVDDDFSPAEDCIDDDDDPDFTLEEDAEKVLKRANRKSGSPTKNRTKLANPKIEDDDPEFTREGDVKKIPRKVTRKSVASSSQNKVNLDPLEDVAEDAEVNFSPDLNDPESNSEEEEEIPKRRGSRKSGSRSPKKTTLPPKKRSGGESTRFQKGEHVSKVHQVCDFCRETVHVDQMLEHCQSHVGDYTLSCPNSFCEFVFLHVCRLKQHLMKNTACRLSAENMPDTCELCGHKAATILSLRKHLRVAHETNEKNFTCPVTGCSEKYTVQQSVYCHISKHSLQSGQTKGKTAPSTMQRCSECPSHVPLEEIQTHLQTVHGTPPESILNCKHCAYVFPSWNPLLDHLAVHIKTDGSVPCDLCNDGKKYARLAILRNHYWRDHQVGERNFVCDMCSTAFPRQEYLQSHIRHMHKDKDARPKETYPCVECPGTEFKAEASLRTHQIRNHGAEPYKCDICSLQFDVFRNFREHENEHKGIVGKTFRTCDVPGCGMSFSTKKGYEHHKASLAHAGRTNEFVCGQCGKGFNTKGNWRNHQMTHSNVRKFVCEVCGSAFKHKEVLKKHKRIHTGEKPFTCDICGQMFRFKEVLGRHLNTHLEKGADFKPRGPLERKAKMKISQG